MRRWDARIASNHEERFCGDRWQWGYAIRRDWPDGKHGLDYLSVNHDAAQRRQRRLSQMRWHPFIKPVTVTVVAANRDLVRTHVTLVASPRRMQLKKHQNFNH
jgi:hypothetical protein